MTLEQIQALSDDEIRVRVAQAAGWQILDVPANPLPYWNDQRGVFVGGGTHQPLPNYPADLNACREAVNLIPDDGSRDRYLWTLKRIIMQTSETQGADEFQVHAAPPRTRCEAFLAVMQPETT